METTLDTTLTLVRTFDASMEDVFNAWLDADALATWYAPHDSFKTIVHTVEAKVGGQYRIEMINAEGQSFIVRGKYLQINKPSKLVFSWEWEHDDPCPSQVTIELTQKGNKTELVLTHTGLPSENSMNMHEEGWTGCLSRLPKAL